ncbi:glucose/sorbosone dehydrogenase family protein [marine gamma proteobacterium HTCC2143]|jgi:glucose/arabinose dehydrogenase|uniref:Glucose/sorbosone dehydrogenase family protein n=1 Tax=marine gamma proteobacterium HTCC2143 TaxID=247633 RepID=A0YEE3_9GAMM|nr:glucose/sorbosone dehydrogenase family protein [marine gamma proteobacterium HTCC2143]
MRNKLLATMLALTVFAISVSAADTAAESSNQRDSGYKVETVADGLDYPWSIAFLPNGDYLVALRIGEVRRINAQGDIGEPLTGLPDTYVASQGGYFDIMLDPDFSTNQTIYLSFAHGNAAANGTRIVKGTLNNMAVENVQTLFTVSPLKDTAAHYGGKMIFLQDGTIMMTTGDGFEYREAAQDTFSLLGKIIRINKDGSVPDDNPYTDGKKGDPRVWSYGHRSPQGLALDTKTGIVYMHEHGPQGGDELNAVLPAVNYGWPAVTQGINYSGAYVSPLKSAPGVVEPLTYWVPSIAPSGLAIYDGAAFPQWQGDLFIGALVDEEVRHLTLESGRVASERPVFPEIAARIRDIRVGPDGFLYILTDSDSGKVLRVVPN